MNSDDVLLAMKKEALLNELVSWLRAKGLFDEAMRDCPNGMKKEADAK